MGSVTHPRGRLPARVYWLRRLLVLSAVLGLVVGGALLAGALSGGTASERVVAQDAAQKSAQKSSQASSKETAGAQASSSAGSEPQAAPSGPCLPSDLTVRPVAKRLAGGRPSTIRLRIRGDVPACTFNVSADNLVVKITSGKDRIWSTQDCPASITPSSVVVRDGRASTVNITWSGRRSEAECPRGTAWARVGYYHLTAAAIGGQPSDTQFRLVSPPAPVVTKTPKPKPEKKARNRNR